MGFSEFLVVLAVITIALYWHRIGKVGGALGRSFGAFKKGLKDEERASRNVEELKPPDKPRT